jgi:hypothetical protein
MALNTLGSEKKTPEHYRPTRSLVKFLLPEPDAQAINVSIHAVLRLSSS